MSVITLTCPHCGFSRQTDRSRIPAKVARAKCPNCLQSFPFSTDAGEPPAASPMPAGAGPVRQLPFVFNGTARDYFGIWTVNTLLKIVTLGIYTPWAKVRKRRFFYGNTLLDDVNFDYLANPLALLKGMLIGAALFALYSLGSRFSPLLSGVLGLIIFVAVPWVIVRSRLFNNRNSAHRNVRFNFKANYREAYGAFLLAPLLTAVTLGIFGPAMVYRQKRFLMENNFYGKTPFTFESRLKDFYLVFLKASGLALLLGAAGFAAFTATLPAFSQIKLSVPAAAFGIPLLFVSGYLLLALYVYVRLTNLTWNSTRLADGRFISTLRLRDMAWIFGSNAAAIALSFGLLTPWAAVRLARYRISRLALETAESLDRFRADPVAAVGAAGEEIGDIFGIEIGFF